jgi:cob(I)alamin adenosyltransferase
MKIYTKTGDLGQTGLYGGGRVAKDDQRIEAYGTVDELNAVLGMVRASAPAPEVDALLARVQNELFDLGAELATPDADKIKAVTIDEAAITRLEAAIDQFEGLLAPLRTFILPGGSVAAAQLHLARTVCRRAERRLVTLSHQEPISPHLVVYLNRLSDLLFVLARFANLAVGVGDVPWQKLSTS